jgi:WD40 repeat protein
LKLAIVPELFRFAPDGKRALAAFADGSLRVWDLSTGRPLTLPFSQGAPVRQIAWSPDGSIVASADAAGRVRIWESATGLPLTSPTAALGSSVRLRITSGGRTLFVWTADGIAERIDLTPRAGSAADLVRLVQVTAGQELHEMGGTLVPLEASRQQQLWRELRQP